MEKALLLSTKKLGENSLPGDPRKCDELVFLITSKVVKIEPS